MERTGVECGDGVLPTEAFAALICPLLHNSKELELSVLDRGPQTRSNSFGKIFLTTLHSMSMH